MTPASGEERSAGSIRGYIRDESTGETLPNVNVAVDSGAVGATTGKGGYYVLSRLSPGPHVLKFSYVGYKKKTAKVQVLPDKIVNYDVELTSTAVDVKEGVEVVGERIAPTDISSVSSFAVRVTELSRIPTVGQPDLLRGVQLLPGVQASSDNSSGLYVRGGTPGQNLILLDDTVVYNPSHLFGFFSTFNPDALKDVMLLKGTFPARYGDRLSSVLDITNLDGNRKTYATHVAADLISGRLTAEGPLGDRASWIVSGRRTYQEALKSPLLKHIVDSMFSTRTGTLSFAPTTGINRFGQRGGIPNFGGRRFSFGSTVSSSGQSYDFYDLNAKINWDVSSFDKVSLSSYFGKDNLGLSLPSFGNTQQRQQLLDWGNQVASLRWTHVFTEKMLWNTLLSASRYMSNFDVGGNQVGGTQANRGPQGFRLNRENRLVDLSMKTDGEYLMSGHSTIRVGAQVTRYDAAYQQGFGDSTRTGIKPVSLYETGYAEYTLTTKALEFTPGVRVSRFERGNYTGVSPRASARYRLSDRVSLKGGWGVYRQYINLISVEGFSYTTDMWLPVDETIRPGRAIHASGGLTVTPGSGWDVDLEYYHKDLSNQVEFQSQVRIEANTPLSGLFLQGTGRAYGGELMIRKTTGATTGWIGYTMGRTLETVPQLNQGVEFPPKYDRRNDISLVLNHKMGRGWNANLNWVYGTGQAYTLPDSRYSVVQPNGQVITYIHASEKNGDRLPPYHRMDMGLTKDFRVGRVGGQFVISVFNVYNRRNVWYRTYDATKDPIQVQDVLLQPMLPSIGFSFKM